MKDILDRLIGAGKTNSIEGALILTILFRSEERRVGERV